MTNRSPAGPLEAGVGRRTTTPLTPAATRPLSVNPSIFATDRHAHVIVALGELGKFYTGYIAKQRAEVVWRLEWQHRSNGRSRLRASPRGVWLLSTPGLRRKPASKFVATPDSDLATRKERISNFDTDSIVLICDTDNVAAR